jgi:hypothetical protein
MKKLWLVIAGVVAVAGIVSVNLWRGLHSERLLNAQLRSQLAEAITAARIPAPMAPPTAQSVPASPSPATSSRAAPSAGMTPMEQDSMNIQLKASTSAVLDSSLLIATAGVSEQDLLKDPEYRRAEVLQLRMRLARANPGLAEAVGISEREAAQLFEAMAEDQLKRTAEMTALRESGETTATVTASILQRNATENPVRIALGEEKFARYQDYQRSVRPALIQVAGIGSMLASVGHPLSDSQARTMATAMMAEQQRQLQAPAVVTPRPAAARGVADALEESANRQDESNRRVLEGVAPILTVVQLGELRQQYDFEAATRRQTIESARRRDAGRPSPAPPFPAIPR